jgi:DNA helicase HerA-like ATPase
MVTPSQTVAAVGTQQSNLQVRRTANPANARPTEVGRILSVGSASVTISVNRNIISKNQLHLAQLGTILKIVTHDSIVIAMVGSLEIGRIDGEGMHDGCNAQLDIMGEIVTNTTTRQTKFFRGVRSFPVLNQAAYTMSPEELELIFSYGEHSTIQIGKLQQDASIVARVRTNDLLSKHFAILGSTGSGKSCTVALVLRAILDENPDAHVVLFDPHNEYSKSFGDRAAVIDQKTLDLPIWLFDFEETTELLTSKILDQKREEVEVLAEVILKAKQLYDRSINTTGNNKSQYKMDDIDKELHRSAAHISLDSPVPYKMRDVLRVLDYYMGKLENSGNIGPYKRLKRRIEALMNDPRYQFVFRNQAAPTSIQAITGAIFRIPVQGKPISILDFSGIPSGALNIVVSVVSRLAFELAMWSQRSIPILLVCEEAHRYIPADQSQGFNATRKAISRIAKEGRKYGVSLGIITQRPSELEPSTLSQCGTVFSMRLSNERDQKFVGAALPDSAGNLLSFLPSLGTAETMVFGESVNLPMRVILSTLEAEYRPHSSSAEFTALWNDGEVSEPFMRSVFKAWRSRSFDPELTAGQNGEAANAPDHHERTQFAQPGTSRQNVGVTRLDTAVPKTVSNQSTRVSEVRNMLNSAFHENL